MNDKRFEEIKQRLSMVTKKPWVIGQNLGKFGPVYIGDIREDFCIKVWGERSVADAEFIAHAKNDIGALCRYVEELEALIDGES